MGLKWTREAPTVAGWYWVREFNLRSSCFGAYDAGPRIVCVFNGRKPGVVAHGTDFGIAMDYVRVGSKEVWAEWAGPIAAPDEEDA